MQSSRAKPTVIVYQRQLNVKIFYKKLSYRRNIHIYIYTHMQIYVAPKS